MKVAFVHENERSSIRLRKFWLAHCMCVVCALLHMRCKGFTVYLAHFLRREDSVDDSKDHVMTDRLDANNVMTNSIEGGKWSL